MAGAGQSEARPENARAAHAVHVVIAVDDNGPVLADRADDPLGSVDHAGSDSGSFRLEN